MASEKEPTNVLLLFGARWVGAPYQVTRLEEFRILAADLSFTKRSRDQTVDARDAVLEKDLSTALELLRSGHFRVVVGSETDLVVLRAHLRRQGLGPIPMLVVSTEGDFRALERFAALAAGGADDDPARDMVRSRDVIWSCSSRGLRAAHLAFGIPPERVVYLPYCTFLRDLSNPSSQAWHARPESADPKVVATARGRVLGAGVFNRDYVTFLEACARFEQDAMILTDVTGLREALPQAAVDRFRAALADAPHVPCHYVSPTTYVACLRAAAVVAVPLFASDFTSGHLTIADAQMLGRPVVATDFPAARDFIEHGRTGLLCAPHDAASLREQLSRLRRDPGLADAIAAEGQRSETRLSEETRAAFLATLRRMVSV